MKMMELSIIFIYFIYAKCECFVSGQNDNVRIFVETGQDFLWIVRE
jgi:hypothetical protein